MHRFVNLTPHAITIVRDDGSTVNVEPSGVFRLRERDIPKERIGGVDVVCRQFYIDPADLAMFDDPTAVYIVSLPALMALETIRYTLPELAQLTIVAPDTGSGAVRDSAGNIIGTRRFVVLS